MGILDEAIREHLELKRAHGADDSELKQLEDQAFGPPERPGAEDAPADPAAEAPTEFMSQPDLADGPATTQDSPPAESVEPPAARREPAAGIADIQEPPQKAEEEPAEEEKAEDVAEDEDPADEPISEEQPAAEHEVVPEPESKPDSHTTEERHAIADQPTQMYDVEEGFASTEAPADEDLVAEANLGEARLGPAEPLTPPPESAAADDDDDDFFSEQRLSDELDQALEAPIDNEPEPEPTSDEGEAPPEHTDEHEVVRESDEDVLEETPDFLEETPEDDQLWFEQKPPKDFDFDD
jgi:hypothetical protein